MSERDRQGERRRRRAERRREHAEERHACARVGATLRQLEVPGLRRSRHLAAIAEHVERHVGPVSGSVRESGPPVLVGIEAPLHVDVLRVPPDAGRPHWTLVTSGMSDLPLPAGRRGAEPGEEHRCELVLCLPPSWRVRARESRWAWPYELLRGLARLPHLARTPLDYGDTWEPRRGRLVARVVGDGAPFAGVLFRASKLLPLELSTGLRVSGRQIDLLAVVLLEREELELKLTRGIAALLDRLDAEGVSELVDLGRQERRRRSA